VAVISGLQAEDHIEHGEAVHRVMEAHEELALITLGIFAVLALWRIVRERRMASRERALTLVLSLGGLGFMFATAIYGGKLVFEHAGGIPSAVLQGELHERSDGHHHEGPGSDDQGHADPAPAGDSATAHVDPPGTPPQTHSHPPGTPPHED
jgi:hypothetical protein